ncbi:hypothetical protein A0257_23085 (plasmid) [Hymenobacter psoromatis]|nr:hypothetical protein A0257_23085 [Hymenobacter psoromatis]
MPSPLFVLTDFYTVTNRALSYVAGLALAVCDQAFTLTPEALALRPLLAALDATVVPTTVARLNEPTAGRHGLAAAQQCGLTPALAGSSLYRVVAQETAAGLRQAVEELFEQATGNQQQTARKKNSKRPHTPAQDYLVQHVRKCIETTFSQLTTRFPKQIHAVTAAGFALKIALFVFVHTLAQAGC